MRIIRFLMHLFWLFPVRKKVFLSSFEGRFIACNPKYIYAKLKADYGNKLTFIWEYNGERNDGLKTVRHNSLRYMYHIMTSAVIITNTGISAVFPLRKKQICINTWHGSGAYKKVGKDINAKVNGTDAYRIEISNRSTTYFISGCEKFTEVMSGAIGLPKEKFLPIGMPRNDLLVKGSGYDIAGIKERLGINKDDRIILYAPTFRGDTNNPHSFMCNLDIKAVCEALKERFGGTWLFAYRCHYHLKSNFDGIPNTVDVSDYEDMQELLAVSDVLITDYSSSVWDYSFTKKPCFLYCYDLDEYVVERDFYVPIVQWGFPLARTNEQLCNNITDFSEEDYIIKMEKHHKDLGSYERGIATQAICDIIAESLKL